MIAFLINELDIRGGTHKQLLKLLQYTEAQGMDFVIITKKVDFSKTYPEFSHFSDKINIVNLEKPLAFGRGGITRGIFTLRKAIKGADVINIHDNGFENYLLAFLGKKVIWQVNDLPYIFKVGVAKNIPISPAQERMARFIRHTTKIVDDFTVNVSKNKDRIKDCFNRDAKVFYCGIEKVEILRDICLTEKRFSNKEIHILTSGVFFRYRNYETQVEVISKLRENGINSHLDVIGSIDLDRKYYFDIMHQIEKEGLSDYITIHGQVDEQKFNELHQNADIFVFVNIDQSWGLAVFEAMSCGLPVIISNSVGATEILTDGENAIFVDPKDVDSICDNIQKLIENVTFYRLISQNSQSLCDKYTWEKSYCSKMVDLFNS